MTSALSVLMSERPSLPAATAARGDRHDVGHVGRELGDQETPRQRAHGGHQRGRLAFVGADRQAAAAHVRAAHVELVADHLRAPRPVGAGEALPRDARTTAT